MHTLRLTTFGCLVLAMPLHAADGTATSEMRTTRQGAEVTAPPAPAAQRIQAAPQAVPADSVAEDLQRVVVLCAIGPGSQQFEDAWAVYVQRHVKPDADVDALIESILDTAQGMRDHRPDSVELKSEFNREALRRSMHDTAKSIIQNVKG